MKRSVRYLGFSAVPLLVFAMFAAVPEGTRDELAAREDLGRMLFWDPILSGPRDIACATCHHPDLAWADGRDLPRGTGSVGLGPQRVDASESEGNIPPVKRNAPTLLNVGFNGLVAGARLQAVAVSMFWDARVTGLEK